MKTSSKFNIFCPLQIPCHTLINTSNILPLNLDYFKTISLMMHDVFNSLPPINISNLFTSSAKIHRYNTRFSAASNFYIKSSRTDHLRNSFSRLGAKIWNNIFESIRLLSKNIFKKKMNKEHLYLLTLEDTYVSVETVMTKLFKT